MLLPKLTKMKRNPCGSVLELLTRVKSTSTWFSIGEKQFCWGKNSQKFNETTLTDKIHLYNWATTN